MDGKRFQKVENEKPIAKPGFPLPTDFSPSKRSEAATRPQLKSTSAAERRAHFYRKQVTDSGAPVYGFYITEVPVQDFHQNR
ncbi:MAG TPA: hypothetical protein VMZ26_04625 [Pyrinomonadaceae bacterium]|nr:hypothetical protein [Pyrinomonadaceae bacterium]